MSAVMNTPEAGRAPPFVIGIDLGTTNCALAYIDTRSMDQQPRVLDIPQWESEGALISAPTLPSFYYLPPKAEWKKGQLALPMALAAAPPDYAVGRFARQKSSQLPGRVIHAAKSWLSHNRIDRTARVLPWHVGELVGDERRSPVEVSAAYLSHLRMAWDDAFATQDPAWAFHLQDVIITVPASFDEVAQRLTLQAAALAEFPLERTRLLEEPQAAFYYWLQQALWRGQQPTPLNLSEDGEPLQVLICDIGGGTTDFSLFRIDGQGRAYPTITRTQVSEHLLLGGDNIDLSLAHLLETRLVGAGQRLSARAWAQLVFATRQLKEAALACGTEVVAGSEPGSDGDVLHVSIAGEGSSLMASAMTATITRREIIAHVADGFIPRVGREERPRVQRSGLQQLNLPYAQDSALTRHLAAFLAGRPVDAVLFTGGTLKPAFMREALLAQIKEWQGREPVVLAHDAMDLAVALGAAVYGGVLRRPEQRIGGGYSRSLYVEVARDKGAAGQEPLLICIVAQGYDGHSPLLIDSLNLKLRTGHPIRFQLLSSQRRPHDRVGDLVAFNASEFHLLPALHTRLDVGAKGDSQLLDVHLEASLAETGILYLHCVYRDHDLRQRWQLDFNVRSTTEPAAAQGASASDRDVPALQLAPAAVAAATALIAGFYGKKKRDDSDPAQAKYLLRDLESALGVPRDEWSTPVLRSLWPTLEVGLTRRNRSVAHEASWLYLAGYALRPGYGYELDEWRIAELWRCFELGLAFPKEKQVEEQWWLMWRRVAGGLNRGQQEKLFDRLFPALRRNEASGEMVMLAGSLERLDMGQKMRLGQTLVQQIVGGRQQFSNQRMWALARIASRVPLYGGPEAIVRPEVATAWGQELRRVKKQDPAYGKLALFLAQAGRLVLDRELDLALEVRAEWLTWMAEVGATAEQQRVVRDFVPVDRAAQTQLFGESLPAGLVLAI